MAGHSQFKNIMHRKGAQDQKRAKVFTKIAKEITVAAKLGGPDITSNPRLRTAVGEARSVNMPKDNIERAIKKATGGDDLNNYEEIRYEGYAPDGVAVIVEALSDNRNRTASEIRSAFSKNGGNLGESGSVSFMFSRCGIIKISQQPFILLGHNFDKLFETGVNLNATDVTLENDEFLVITELENLHYTTSELIKKFTLNENDISATISWLPKHLTTVTNIDTAKEIINLLNTLEDLDDVQKVFANYDVSTEIMNQLET